MSTENWPINGTTRSEAVALRGCNSGNDFQQHHPRTMGDLLAFIVQGQPSRDIQTRAVEYDMKNTIIGRSDGAAADPVSGLDKQVRACTRLATTPGHMVDENLFCRDIDSSHGGVATTDQTGGVPLAAAYSRSATQDDESHDRLDAQINLCRAAAEAAGYHVHPCHTFHDFGSGITLARAGLTQLRSVVRSQKVEAVWVSDCARLSRDLLDLMGLIKEFKEHSVVLHVVDGNFASQQEEVTTSLDT